MLQAGRKSKAGRANMGVALHANGYGVDRLAPEASSGAMWGVGAILLLSSRQPGIKRHTTVERVPSD
jgi:hypothetical protein